MRQRQLLREQIISEKPTDQQRDAIFATDLEFLLRAAPGSGKTWTSCRRFIWRAANWTYSAGGIALVSFTNAAVHEFEKATARVGQQNLLSDPNYLGTFDAFVERFILTPFGHLLCGSSKRPRLLLAPRAGDWNNKKLLAWTQSSAGKKFRVPAWEMIPYLNGNKASFRASPSFGGHPLQLTAQNPVRELISLGYYTHSQRAYWACRLLFDRPHIAARLAMRFPEIVVDEAQDTNTWLLVLLNFLRERGSKITLVGDPDQCIYSFAMADATSLSALKQKWQIGEKPLSRSFRCNDEIAAAVRNVGGNADFTGRGESGGAVRRAFIVREPSDEGYAASVAAFKRALVLAGILETSSVIVCRGREQLQSVRGRVNYSKLQGISKTLAEAAFYRDCRRDYKEAFKKVEGVLRAISGDDAWRVYDEFRDCEESRRITLELWRFVKSESGLPSVGLIASDWLAVLKERLGLLLGRLGVNPLPNLGQRIQKRGLKDNQLKLPLFQSEALFPAIRQETIHKVKGESIDAVLVLGSAKFWNSVMRSVANCENTEDRRLAYVGMSRARDLLVVSLPTPHFDKYSAEWVKWGFEVL